MHDHCCESDIIGKMEKNSESFYCNMLCWW